MDQVEPDFSAGRIFQPSRWKVLKVIPFLLFLILISAYGIYYTLFGNFFRRFPETFRLFLAIIPASFESGFIFSAITFASEKLILYPNAIELRTLFSSQRLERSEIAGFSFDYGKSGGVRSFIPIDATNKTMEVSYVLIPEPIFVAWVQDIPDVTGRDAAAGRKRLEDTISQNAALGNNPSEKMAWFEQIHKAQKFLVSATLIVSALFFFGIGTAYLAVILFTLPWVAMIALVASRGTLTAFISTTDPRPCIAWLIGIPGMVILAGPPYWTNLTGSEAGPVAVCLFSGVVLTGIVSAIDRAAIKSRMSWGLYIIFFTNLLCASWYEFDVELDNRASTDYSTTIVAMHVQHQRGSHNCYLTLPPWGDVRGQNDYEVSEDFYDRMQVGSTVHVTRHPGAFGYPWYTISE